MSKKVLVVGLQKSGLAAYNLLIKQGYDVCISVNETLDDNTLAKIPKARINHGSHDLTLLDEHWDFIVKNPGVPYHIPFIVKALEKNIEIISEIELAYRFQPQSIYLAITGTNGKTTTTTLIYEILKKVYSNVYLAGNIGIPLSQVVLEHPQKNIYVVELSSFQIMGTNTFKPFISSIINLAPDHLDYMNSVKEYYESKQGIYANQDANDFFILNKDDDLVNNYLDNNLQTQVITYSLNKKADVYFKDEKIYFYDEEIIDTKKIQMIGTHNLYNIIVAIIYTRLMNVDISIIQEVIYNFNAVAYRLEKVEGSKNNIYYNDSKSTTPDSTITALKALKNKPINLIMGGFDKGLDFSELVDLINDMENVKSVYLYGQIKDKIKGINKKVHCFESLNLVVEDILRNVDNEVILFSCATSSYDQYENFEKRGEHFNKLIKGD